VRAKGNFNSFMDSADKIQYRVDLMGVAGSEDFTLTAPAGSSSVVVTGRDDRDVMGWGFDAGIDVPLALSWKPLVHLGYAYGSGDNGSGDDGAFRQSGLEGNFSRVGVLSQSVQNYGTVLRPDLSNLHILSAGLTMPLFSASDAGVIYHYYRLADDATGLISSGVNDTLSGDSHDVGQGIDLLFNTGLYERADKQAGQFNSAYLRTSLGAFRAGDAYGANEGEIAGRALVEVGLNF
jgi:alginate production protein